MDYNSSDQNESAAADAASPAQCANAEPAHEASRAEDRQSEPDEGVLADAEMQVLEASDIFGDVGSLSDAPDTELVPHNPPTAPAFVRFDLPQIGAKPKGRARTKARAQVFGGTRKVSRSGDDPAAPAADADASEIKEERKAKRVAARKAKAATHDWLLDTWRRVVEHAGQCAAAETNLRNASWSQLDKTYAFVQNPNWTAAGFKSFCADRDIPCTKATQANPFKAVITASRVAASRPIDTKEASRLGRALVWARQQGVAPDALVAFLERSGGVSGCILALVAANKAAKAAKAAAAAEADRGYAAASVECDDAVAESADA